mmetsp:Transcript_1852/g.5589  ORF Transcript_1852/g.5589 Transcript_1852/m.5589 type:complete len:351 (+) Transcript_1852:104-1156(+)
MDSLSTVFPDSVLAVGSKAGMGPVAETLICVAVAMVVLRIELQRRAGTGPNFGSRDGIGYAESAKRILRQCAPEAAAIIACLTLAAALRARGDTTKPINDEAWAKITREWPLLVTADTLLSLQAMLRYVILLSVALRAGSGGPVPLSDEPAALWLAGGVARVALLARSKVYMLDGPLGGALPAACEVLVLPLLLVLGRGALKRAFATLVLAAVATAHFSRRNRLALASGDAVSDGLFIAAHSLDFLAAFAYLMRSLLIDNGARWGSRHISVGFTHLLMPIQQSLAAYYFLKAFSYSPGLVGSGMPFEVLQISNTAQLGAYCAALALYLADLFEAQTPRGIAGSPALAAGS